jgi:hypothetical protein
MREQAITAMQEVFGEDQRRIKHALKVLCFAEKIADGENIAPDTSRIITLAAILHDIGMHQAENKYNSTAGHYQESEGPPIARDILNAMGIPPTCVERVCYIIGHHHTPSAIDGVDFQIVWEADWLVNIEEEGIDREREKVTAIIVRNFATKTGISLARTQYGGLNEEPRA